MGDVGDAALRLHALKRCLHVAQANRALWKVYGASRPSAYIQPHPGLVWVQRGTRIYLERTLLINTITRRCRLNMPTE